MAWPELRGPGAEVLRAERLEQESAEIAAP
jgi:hypothetical protein